MYSPYQHAVYIIIYTKNGKLLMLKMKQLMELLSIPIQNLSINVLMCKLQTAVRY